MECEALCRYLELFSVHCTVYTFNTVQQAVIPKVTGDLGDRKVENALKRRNLS